MSMLNHLGQRLWWEGRRGGARSRDVSMSLAAPPALPFDFLAIDYCPAVGVYTVRRSLADGNEQDMRPDEIAACRNYLNALDGPPDMEPDA